MPKTKKRKLGKAPSREEVAGFRETSDLFRSNLFRLQTAELLREVRPAHGEALRPLEGAIRALREALLGVPAAELAYAAGKKAPRVSHPELAALRLHGASVQLAFEGLDFMLLLPAPDELDDDPDGGGGGSSEDM